MTPRLSLVLALTSCVLAAIALGVHVCADRVLRRRANSNNDYIFARRLLDASEAIRIFCDGFALAALVLFTIGG